MKFLITRASTSAYKPDQKPCEEAIKLEGDCYGIKLKSLDDLIELSKKVNCPIILYHKTAELPLLQIYDDFIE